VATARYLMVDALSPPRAAGVDGERRQVFTFTVVFMKHPTGTFAEEAVALLVAAGVGVFNQDIFMGDVVTIPPEGGPYIHLTESGGTSNERTHNIRGPAYERPGLIVRVHDPDYLVCRNKARHAYDTLVSVTNQTVTFS
jgi:hypothetical protein